MEKRTVSIQTTKAWALRMQLKKNDDSYMLV